MLSSSLSRRKVAAAAMTLLITALASARIVATYRVFSQTVDEPAHVAAGMEWLDRGTYTFEVLHPPLARIAVAVGPFLAGNRLPHEKDMWKAGNEILYAGGHYSRNLALARLGVLPFFVLGSFVVYLWSRELFQDGVALVSVFVFTMLPPILGHSGLATTDMPVAAGCVAALFAFTRWLDLPDVPRSLTLGGIASIAVLSKFPALLFLPAGGLAILGCRRWLGPTRGTEDSSGRRRRVVAVALAIGTACVMTWAGYRFSFAPLASVAIPRYRTLALLTGQGGSLHDLTHFVARSVPIPAPGLLGGLVQAAIRNMTGEKAYLLGRIRQGGWWYFFWVVLAFKSPIPFLVMVGVGTVFLVRDPAARRDWRLVAPAVTALSILLVTMPVRINYGVRHILVVYPLLAMVAGFGVAALWNLSPRRFLNRAAATLLVVWLVISSVRAHPDYLAYFNGLAGSHPERILIDSDLDWGQDLLRLSDALHQRAVAKVAIAYYGTADLERHNLPPFTELRPLQPTSGWIAISLDKTEMAQPAGAFSWLDAYQPVALIGRSIRLYDIPDATKP